MNRKPQGIESFVKYRWGELADLGLLKDMIGLHTSIVSVCLKQVFHHQKGHIC